MLLRRTFLAFTDQTMDTSFHCVCLSLLYYYLDPTRLLEGWGVITS
jgi:hypothetical protein